MITVMNPNGPRTGATRRENAKPGLGDRVERLVKPIAVALKLDCLDAQKRLKPESPCGKRRAWLNEAGKKIGIGAWMIGWLLCAAPAARADTNQVWIPYGHTNAYSLWWTNAVPEWSTNGSGSVTNWQAWQAVNYNFQQVWFWMGLLPTTSTTNTWLGSNSFSGTVWAAGFSGSAAGLTNAAPSMFAATNSPAPGDTIRWDGTNWYWGP